MDRLSQSGPLFATLIVVALCSWLAHKWLLAKPELTAEQRLPRQLSFGFLLLTACIAIILALPVSEGSRNQILALLGILISGVIAFSSTTIMSNLMAGIVLRMNRPFKTGDFIRCNQYFGRVSEKGLLDTEIQTEQRELVSIANSYLISNPVSVIRSSGTLITADVSIGYDVHHDTVEDVLEVAAKHSALSDAFVQVLALGDFSVSYRVSGLLTEIKGLLTAKSRLHKAILDEFHQRGIEILSPNYMAQRPTDPALPVIPSASVSKQPKDNVEHHEEVAFDKAEQAQQHEHAVEQLQKDIEQFKVMLNEASDSEQKAKLKASIEQAQSEIASLLEVQKQQLSNEDAHQ
ncbi:mechanosensitive ion channel family protein [Alteromonas facilis]|uniref:mechanosensitive ion channel family protein n=1 Tax=Alteromonas facilis TaxID=2048004 RepID=UPI0013DA0587|nr:mechanosensitive ion channel domain-containing protein [Alteromonas facilis]